MLTLALSRAVWDVPSLEVFEPLCWLTGATTVGSGLTYLVGDGACRRRWLYLGWGGYGGDWVSCDMEVDVTRLHGGVLTPFPVSSQEPRC